jgi:hypothetical protein
MLHERNLLIHKQPTIVFNHLQEAPNNYPDPLIIVGAVDGGIWYLVLIIVVAT